MKIVFSRKGFDSSFGGVASPILPDGTMLSLPIPRQSSISYNELNFNGESLGRIVQDLTKGDITGERSVHLDPDLRASLYSRHPGWRPLFDQRGARQRHLDRWGISLGDLFLFFGWLREVEFVGGTYRFVKGAPDLHVLFGWLQIDEIIRVKEDNHHVPAWATYHPHFNGNYVKIGGRCSKITIFLPRVITEKGDMLYSPCQEKNEHLRNINNYNVIDNTHFPEHTYP